jgi:hypothetical protein
MYKCKYCSYFSKTKFNTIRHQQNKHKSNIYLTDNVNDLTDNVNDMTGNVNDTTGKINDFICDYCGKSFTRKYGLNQHKNICKGVSNALECQYCNNIYASYASKSAHIKICKKRKEQETIKQEEKQNEKPNIMYDISGDHNSINNSTNTNIDNSTNNIDNSVTNNINNTIVFNNSKEITPFIMGHINSGSVTNLLKKYIQIKKETNSYDIEDMYKEFYKLVCENDSNKYIIKSNKKYDISKVHIGNGKWETIVDKKVYGKLVKDVSVNLKNKIDENENVIKTTFKSKLIDYSNKLYEIIDTYTENIYEEETELLKNLKLIIKNLKCVILDIS